jgi:hypothetical protein
MSGLTGRWLLVARWVAAASLAFGVGCGDSGTAGSGAARVRVSGEGAAKTGYPYDRQGVEISFVDGWTLTFDKVLVSVSDLRLEAGDDEVTGEQSWIVDLHLGDPALFEFTELAPQRWDFFGFDIAPPMADAEVGEGVDGADVERMIAEELSYLVAGSATHPERGEIRFEWGFPVAVRHRNCTNGLDGTAGIVVRENSATDAEITIHMDHVFWDTLGTEVAQLRFDPIWGADVDEDGEVTVEELAAQRISALTDPTGAPLTDETGAPLVYDPGSLPLPDKNLYEFIVLSMASMAHLNGLGLCSVERL